MSEHSVLPDISNTPLVPPSDVNKSPGAILRAARQAAGLHIDGLAVSLKVSVKKLESLESDQFEAFPDTVFARSLAASVCRTLKIDPVPVLALMPQGNKYRLPNSQEGINATFRGDFGGHSVFWRGKSYLRNPTALAVMVLLISALVLVLLPYTPENTVSGAAVDETASTSASASTESVASQEANPLARTSSALPEPGRIDLVSAAASSLPIAPASSKITSVANLPKDINAAAASVASAASAPASSAANIAAIPSGILAFKARSSSWVKVRDSSGTTILQRTLAAGESVAVPSSSNFPWSVVVGRANVTDVYVRGALFDMVSTSRENVARFEVK